MPARLPAAREDDEPHRERRHQLFVEAGGEAAGPRADSDAARVAAVPDLDGNPRVCIDSSELRKGKPEYAVLGRAELTGS